MRRNAKVVGWRISTLDDDESEELPRIRTTKAPYKARETRAADPMAKPLPTAAVVLPSCHPSSSSSSSLSSSSP